MKTKALFAVLAIFSLVFASCDGDIPPGKSVGNITFIITEENTPQTLSGVSIQLFSDKDPSVTPTDRTDNSGRCTFSNIPIGTYKVHISKPGYESKEGLTLKINGGDNSYKEISLKRTTTTLTIAPDVLDFGDKESVVQKAFSLVNPNYADLTWAVLDTDVPWILSVCDKDGKKNGTIKYNQEVAMSVTIDRDALASGNNESTVVILSDNGRAELHVTAVGADRRLPVTEITDVTNIDLQSAIFKGKVLSVGAPKYEERGFVYSTSPIAEDATNGFTKIPSAMNSDDTFNVTASGLEKGKTYYVRSYGKNSLGLKLSSTYKTFTTIVSKTAVNTLSVTPLDIVNGKAQFNGTITEIGNPAYSEKGFCYNTTGEPTISDKKYTVSGTSGGNYSYQCAGLATNTTYYVRAYAIQNDNIYYGTSVTYSTDLSKTGVSTSSATNITSYSATLNGSISSIGNPPYSEKGFCISTTSNYPTINDIKEPVSGSGEGNFSLNIIGLNYNNRYYYRAYAIQDGEPVYGSVASFVPTYTEADVITSDVTNIGYTSITLNGEVTNIGAPIISERGFCYCTDYDYPTISDNKVEVSGSRGSFKVTLKNLNEDTKYFVRAYVIQDGKVIYGNLKEATTYRKPIVETGPAISIKLSSNGFTWQATLQGAFLEGNPYVTDAGFVYGISNNPTITTGTKVRYSNVEKIKTDIYKFTTTVNDFFPMSNYYVRAYVTTSLGEYFYGESISFWTE